VLRLADRWVWDSWIADTGTDYHLFYLQAPRGLRDQRLRHTNATVGHAVSTDLRVWTVLPDALRPGPPGAWDDVATWTGSVIRANGRWRMLYTGIGSAEAGLVQRIGIATSDDLLSWTKEPVNPLLEADARWYERLDRAAWYDETWRDPWVFVEPEGGFHALITARVPDGAADARGVIGHAWSADLLTWTVRPPLTVAGEFGQLEVPQVEIVDGTAVLLFSCARRHIGAARRARLPHEPSGSFLAIGESATGPFDITGARPIPIPDLYSARLVRDRAGAWQILGFVDGSDRDAFVGEIIDPVPLASLGLP
jgi:beta-fructofuranosidase